MTDSKDHENDENEESESELDEILSGFEEKREADRERVTVEWCQTIRDVGEAYRETGGLQEVAEKLDLDLERAREAAIVYRIIFADPPEDVSTGAHATAVDYYSEGHDVESLSFGSEEDEFEGGKRYLREFVGAVYRLNDVEEEDEIGEIPEEMNVNLSDIDFDFGFEEVFSGLNALNDISSMFNESVFAPGFDQDVLVSAIDAMSYQQDLNNIALMTNSLPRIAQQLSIPKESFAEIAATFNELENLQPPPVSRLSIDDFDEPPTPDDSPEAQAETVEEEGELTEELRDLEEDDVESLGTEEAVEYSVLAVGRSLRKPNTKEWYLNSSSRIQTTIVRVLLFMTVLSSTGGNVVIASAVAMVLGPGLADVLSRQLETEEA